MSLIIGIFSPSTCESVDHFNKKFTGGFPSFRLMQFSANLALAINSCVIIFLL